MNTLSPDDLETLAALAALDWLAEAERAALEAGAPASLPRHLETAAALLEAAPPRQPPPALRERLLARLPGAAGAAEFLLAEGIVIIRSGRKPWEETGFPGIRRKRLYFDERRRYASNLVSMRAGSVYPRHWHADLEELYMLSGEVRLGGHTLGPGDYCRADPGTVHAPVVAESDCVFVAMSSAKDQILSPLAIGQWLAGRLARWAGGADS